jgi:hypothetical protein
LATARTRLTVTIHTTIGAEAFELKPTVEQWFDIKL